MKVLITGGGGFLGSNLAAHYLSNGAEVVILDALFRRGAVDNLSWLQSQAKPHQFHFIQADVANQEAVECVFRRHAPFDFICHVGGQVAMTTSLSDPRRDLQTNVLGTFNVLEAMRAYSPDALLAYSSTNKVYGDLEHLRYAETETRFTLPDFPNGLDESLPLDFSTPYGCSKGAADQYVRDWSRVYGLKTVVFRHSSIYGGRQFATFDQGWIGWFCQKALEQQADLKSGRQPEAFTISGTGKQVRDVLRSEDLVSLYDAAFQCADKVSGKIFNIGGGMPNSLSLLELLDLLRDLLELPQALVYSQLPRRQSDQDFFVADVSAIKAATGWEPRISARQGVGRMLEWLA